MGRKKETPLYVVWKGMKARCTNKNHNAYKYYGEKGVCVCDEWKFSFLSFSEWCLANNWVKGLHIDRIDSDGNYDPLNCRVVTIQENLAVGRLHKRHDNKSGYVGVKYQKDGNGWVSQISIKSKRVHLGFFKSIEDAIKARVDAEILYLGEQKTNFITG